jgi:hypothetical protein
MSTPDLSRAVLMPRRPQAHVWVREGRPTLTIITDADEGVGFNWPDDAGPLIVFDASYDVTLTAVQS